MRTSDADRTGQFWTPIPHKFSIRLDCASSIFRVAPLSPEPLVELLVDPAGLYFRVVNWGCGPAHRRSSMRSGACQPARRPPVPLRVAQIEPLSTGPVTQGTLNGSASFACEEEGGSSMKQDLPPVTVLATFSDRVSAEIACALLSEASIQSGEPEPAEEGTWLVSVRGVHPELAGRAEVILRSARARETTIASGSNRRFTAVVNTELQFTSATRTACRRLSFKEHPAIRCRPNGQTFPNWPSGTSRSGPATTW